MKVVTVVLFIVVVYQSCRWARSKAAIFLLFPPPDMSKSTEWLHDRLVEAWRLWQRTKEFFS